MATDFYISGNYGNPDEVTLLIVVDKKDINADPFARKDKFRFGCKLTSAEVKALAYGLMRTIEPGKGWDEAQESP